MVFSKKTKIWKLFVYTEQCHGAIKSEELSRVFTHILFSFQRTMSKNLLRSVLASFIVGAHIFVSTASSSQKGQFYFESHLYHKLFAPLSISSLLVRNGLHCGHLCAKEKHCLSLNVGLKADAMGYYSCQLLGITRQQNSSMLISSKDFHHYSFLEKVCIDLIDI